VASPGLIGDSKYLPPTTQVFPVGTVRTIKLRPISGYLGEGISLAAALLQWHRDWDIAGTIRYNSTASVRQCSPTPGHKWKRFMCEDEALLQQYH